MDGPMTNSAWAAFETKLRSYVRGRVNADAVDDVVSDILLNLFRSQDKMAGAKNPLAWMYRVAANVITDHYRKYARELFRFLITRRHSQIVNTSFLIPRMLRWSLSREPITLSWMEPEYAIYLLQLENLLEGATRVQ